MSVNDRDLSALEYLAERIRQDTPGCATWDRAGTHVVFAAELKGKHLVTAIELVLAHAPDPEAKSPGAIKRPFTPAKAERSTHWTPPKRDEECPKHPGKHRDSCGGCVADELAVEYDEPAPTPIKATGDTATWAEMCRQAMRGETA